MSGGDIDTICYEKKQTVADRLVDHVYLILWRHCLLFGSRASSQSISVNISGANEIAVQLCGVRSRLLSPCARLCEQLHFAFCVEQLPALYML